MYASMPKKTRRFYKLNQKKSYETLFKMCKTKNQLIKQFSYADFSKFLDDIFLGMFSIGLTEDKPIAFNDLFTLRVVYYDDSSKSVSEWNTDNKNFKDFVKITLSLRSKSRKFLLALGRKFWITLEK